MSFSTDRDLLAYEPKVFNEVSFGTQTRVSVSDGVVSGTTLTSASADFEAAQVDAGDVVLIADVGCEVISRTDANTLEVSLPRAELADAAIPPGDDSALTVVAQTFANQATVVRRMLLEQLGLDPDETDVEDKVVTLSMMNTLETLGTLARIYTGAVVIGADNVDVLLKAKDYHDRFDATCRVASIELDLDGDGLADAVREMGVVSWVRI